MYKLKLLSISIMLGAVSALCASPFYFNGRNALASQNLNDAYLNFELAVNSINIGESYYEEANMLFGVVRLVNLLESNEVQTLLTNGGANVVNQDLYNYHLEVPEDSEGVPVPDTNFATDEVKTYVLTHALPELEAAIDNLELVTAGFLLTLTSAEVNGSSSVTIDYADVVLLKAMYKGIASLLHVAKNYDSNIVLYDLYQLHQSDELHIQGFLNLYPQYFKRMPANQLVEAEALFRDAIADYNAASDLIRARQHLNRLFDLPYGQETIDEMNVRVYMNDVLASLDAPTLLHPTDLGRDIELYLRPLFNGDVYPEELYPEFYENYLVEGSIPDVTFDGLFPFLTANDIYKEVTLGQYPSFLYEPFNEAGFEGDGLYLWGYAVGKPAVSYQWYKDGVPVDGDANFLNFDKLTMSDNANYTLEAINGLGSITADPVSLTVIQLNNISVWRSSFLSGFDASDEADPDEDGLSNLLEYALGTDPTKRDQSPTQADYNRATDRVELTYDKHRLDITYTAEASTDLASWSDNGVFQDDSQPIGERTASVQISPDTKKFIRLKISN